MQTKAMIVNQYGEKSEFSPSDITLPKLEPHKVLVKVHATSLNPLDNKIFHGALPLGPDLPSPLHGDLSGTVIEIGSDVSSVKVGDEVYGIAGGLKNYSGASAQHMIVDEELIAHKPTNISFEEAAAIPLVAITAYEGLIDKAKIKPGDEVLVIGGMGGVGHMAIQIAKLSGAKVTTTVSKESLIPIAKGFGADHVIVYKTSQTEDYLNATKNKQGFDIVFDTVGEAQLDTVFNYVKINGQIITTLSGENQNLTNMLLKGLSLHVVFMLLPMLTGVDKIRHKKILEFLKQKIEQGKIKPLIDKTIFPLQDINDAHRYYEAKKNLGKIVINNLSM